MVFGNYRAVLVGRELPDRAVLRGGIEIQPLRCRLLSRHDDVNVVAASQAVVDH